MDNNHIDLSVLLSNWKKFGVAVTGCSLELFELMLEHSHIAFSRKLSSFQNEVAHMEFLAWLFK